MTLVELRDRDELASFFRRRPEVHAYELGDLDDFFWPHTRWFGWLVEDRLEQVALLYGEPDPPVLVALAEDPERVFHKDELLRDVWGFRSLGRTRTLDSHASRLRRKLNLNGELTYIVNVWGVGYRLVPAV